MKIIYSPRFQKNFKKLSIEIIDNTIEKILLLEENLFHTQLKTHKLHGKLNDYYSFSVNYKYRVIFEVDKEEIILLDIGDHDIYKQTLC